VREVAKPLFESAGFTLEDPSTIPQHFVFVRPGRNGLVEAVTFYSGKTPKAFAVELALVRPTRHPLEASFPGLLLGKREREVGVRDRLFRVTHGSIERPGQDLSMWTTEQELRAKVDESTRLALDYGPEWWSRYSRRLRSKG
jgi:hypothetical protein